MSIKNVSDQFTVPANVKISYAYKYGNILAVSFSISNIKNGWNSIEVTMKDALVGSFVAAVHKSTITDNEILVSCFFGGKNMNILSSADFSGDLTANFILLVK